MVPVRHPTLCSEETLHAIKRPRERCLGRRCRVLHQLSTSLALFPSELGCSLPERYCSRGPVHVQELACRSLGAKNAGSRDIWLIFSSMTLEGRKGTVRCLRGLDAHVLRVVFSKAEYIGRWVLLDFLALECLMDCDCPVQPGSQTTCSGSEAVFSGREWVLGLSTGGNADPGVMCPGKKDCQQRRAAAFLGRLWSGPAMWLCTGTTRGAF